MLWRKTGLLLAAAVIIGLIGSTALRLAAETDTTVMNASSSSWVNPTLVSGPSTFGAFTPTLEVAPNGNMMLMYSQRISSQSPATNPYYRILPAGSSQWSALQPVQSSPGESLGQVSFAFNSASVAHAVWRTNNAIFHARQDQWPDSHNIVNSRGWNVYDPSIAIGPDNVVHIVWRETDPAFPSDLDNVYHSYSTNNGAAWSAPTPVASNLNISTSPSIAIDVNGNAHVAWEERLSNPTRYQIWYKRGAKDGGSYTWDAAALTLSDALTTARQPKLLAEGNVIHLSYTNRISNDEQYAYYRQRASNGSWGTPIDVTQNNPVSVNSAAPFYLLSDMAVCNDSLVMFYNGNPTIGAREQIYAHRYTAETGWSARETITPGIERTVRPSVACRNNVLQVVYEVVVTVQNHQIYHMFAQDMIFLPVIRR